MKLNELIQQLSGKLNIELYEVAYGVYRPYRPQGKSPDKDYFMNLDDAIKFAREKSLNLHHDESHSSPKKPYIHRYKLENGVKGSWSSEPSIFYTPSFLELELLFTVKYVEKINYKHPEFDNVQEEATVS